MASEAQINANRINATKSHGALTPETQETCSQNARKHGLCAKKLGIHPSDREEYDQMVTIVIDHYKPGSDLERLVIQEVANLQWKLSRIPYYEGAINTRALREQGDTLTLIEDNDERYLLELGAIQTVNSKALTNLTLQQSRTQRSLEKELTRFNQMRQERESVAKVAADLAEVSITGTNTPLATVGVVFSYEYLVHRVAFRKHNPTVSISVFDRFWGDPKAKTPA